MWGALLEPFLFFFILKLFVAMGNTYPITGSELSKNNNIMTSINDSAATVTPYVCVYIPPNLDFCKFISYKSKENLWNSENKLLESKKHKLMESNKMYFTSRPLTHIPGAKKFQNHPFVKTIIYEIQRCIPPRLPFVLPWCTDEDLSDKKSEIRRLYPFMIDGFSKATYEFPMYDFLKQSRVMPKSA
ncbi:PREDICTED: uncharacterized protein LOC108684638 isoform X1 [Atta colombica]|nr:PREDICTED: uncharacterized protein LOC108684638 isoform X1 [Atta colombica]XP_018044550.1 PREDICTED: uncharacterized protein LOC108684638 isoform X1 [Atta colombica]XP_018044551.1 PREDICTED: uncharacterized protein LOC108684638 isoform X1 [Atta colombica]XP_018044552.1 PREDICTED: uncharacterized protein LOC108684638 isoform X1 [Atta colombica]XP_018044553.1 PREDICTED: uncharacterized protein LOC108684638 isoform X1 [Atta colombica]XP_018044554.1 PREDICTED: uncharacterized protein LOC1086846